MQWRGLIGGIFWLVLGILFTYQATSYEIGSFTQPGPGFFPLGLGIILTLLAVTIVGREAKKFSLRVPETAPLLGEAWKKVGYTVAILFLAALFFETIGYLLTFFFLILLLMSVVGGQDWKRVLLIAFCSALGAYLIFVLLLEQPLPRGILVN